MGKCSRNSILVIVIFLIPKHQQTKHKMPKAILRDSAICNRAFKLEVLGSIPRRAEHNAVQMVSRRSEESAGPSAEVAA